MNFRERHLAAAIAAAAAVVIVVLVLLSPEDRDSKAPQPSGGAGVAVATDESNSLDFGSLEPWQLGVDPTVMLRRFDRIPGLKRPCDRLLAVATVPNPTTLEAAPTTEVLEFLDRWADALDAVARDPGGPIGDDLAEGADAVREFRVATSKRSADTSLGWASQFVSRDRASGLVRALHRIPARCGAPVVGGG